MSEPGDEAISELNEAKETFALLSEAKNHVGAAKMACVVAGILFRLGRDAEAREHLVRAQELDAENTLAETLMSRFFNTKQVQRETVRDLGGSLSSGSIGDLIIPLHGDDSGEEE